MLPDAPRCPSPQFLSEVTTIVSGVSVVDLLDAPGFRGLDASMVPELRAVRRHGPPRSRRSALLALLHLGGEQALDAADLAALRRLIAVKQPHDAPRRVGTCFTAWLTVRGGDQEGILRVLGLTRSAPATYGLGQTLVGHPGHGGPDGSRPGRHVFVSPQLNGWTVVFGSSCHPGRPHVASWIERLSARYGDAQAYFFGSQGDGSAWLVGVRGSIVRRFSSTEPASRPVSRCRSSCGRSTGSASLSIDPVWTGWPADLEVRGLPLVAWPEEDDDVSILRGAYTFTV